MKSEDEKPKGDTSESREQLLRILDAKVETLWQLGEPTEKTKMPVKGDIPVITDIERNVAEEAAAAIAEKYNIKTHDLYMFRRAQIMALYFELGRGCPLRVELSPAIDSKIKWQ